jgi:glucose/arabinose dehydrogenase
MKLKRNITMLLIGFISLFSSLSAVAKYSKVLLKDGFNIPWGIVDLGGELLITERSGLLKGFNKLTKKVVSIQGLPEVFARGQGGLLDIEIDPDFTKNKKIYISYSKSINENKTTALGVGTYIGSQITSFKEIFVAKGTSTKRIHFGSRIAFDENKKLYLSVGDRGNRDNAQNLGNHFGKIIRINRDGSIPKDNPFLKSKNILPEIWSYGHRNPQGLYFDKETKILYEMEHGPRGGDEINIIEKGANFGWPIISYGKEYMLPLNVGEGTHKKGMKQPIKFYVPSIAPSDLILYRGEKYPELKGSLLSGALKLTHINSFNPETKKEIRLLNDQNMRIRSLTLDIEGQIIFGTDDGKIYSLKRDE